SGKRGLAVPSPGHPIHATESQADGFQGRHIAVQGLSGYRTFLRGHRRHHRLSEPGDRCTGSRGPFQHPTQKVVRCAQRGFGGAHVTAELVPALRDALEQTLPAHEVALEISDDAEKLYLYYPSAVENTDAYLRPSVLIEFGGRNATLPQDSVTIVPDVAVHVPGLVFPTAQVAVLSPIRTFWEKATLIHVECHRPDLRVGAERLVLPAESKETS